MEEKSQLHDPAVYPGKEHCHKLNRKLGGTQSWSGRFGDKSLNLPVIEPLIFSAYPNHYTDSAMPAPSIYHTEGYFCDRSSGSPT